MGGGNGDALCLADLFVLLRQYAASPSVSNEELMNGLLDPYVRAGNVRNRNGYLLELDKSRVSRILLRKDPVPRALKNALQQSRIAEKTSNNMPRFVEEYLEPDRLDRLIDDLQAVTGRTGDERTDKGALVSRLLTAALMSSFRLDNRSKQSIEVWERSSARLEVIEGDLLRYGFNNRRKTKNIVVIPVNDTFETNIVSSLEQESSAGVSELTLHGQWLLRMMQRGLDQSEIKGRIAGYLANHCDVIVEDSSYPIGTVAVIEEGNAAYFLLVISRFDSFGRAQSSPEAIETALRALINFYDVRGQGYDLYLPLLGSGRSRAGLTPIESARLISKVLDENLGRVFGRIVLVTPPAVFESNHQLWKELR